MSVSLPIHGRGANTNPANRFEAIGFAADGDYLDALEPEDRVGPRTQIFIDTSRSIIATNESPDIPFTAGINVYRGCEHGCSYCFARPYHEYLGLSAGVDFETKIFIKPRAAELLRETFSKKSWQPRPVAMSGVTDPYQPIERKLGITRQVLEVFAAFRNPIGAISKNFLISRDADLLGDLAKDRAATATLSITTLDPKLAGLMEPRASSPKRRLEAIAILARAGVPVGVSVSPVIPGLNDHEVPAILKAAREAGAKHAFYVPLRLPGAVQSIFLEWLNRHFPDRYEKVVNRVTGMKRGRMNQPGFGDRFTGTGVFFEAIASMVKLSMQRLKYEPYVPLNSEAFRVQGGQMKMW